jgi:uncharacterized protein YjiS (DUF1127 family)
MFKSHSLFMSPAAIDRVGGVRTLRWPHGPAALVARWLDRARSRRALADLNDHLLRDVGLTAAEARRESAKPFWLD